MDFGTRFDIISKQMQLEFDRIRGEISHPEEKGKLFEAQFRRFLKEYFPKTLDISTGFIIDSNDKSSNQLDIVISDAARTPIFYQDNEKRIRIIPAECVYAVIEVKANLNLRAIIEHCRQCFFC